MSFRRSESETAVINHRTGKGYVPGANRRPEMKLKSGTVEDKTFGGVFARPVPWGRPAQHSVPARGPRGILKVLPPPSIRYTQPNMALPVTPPMKYFITEGTMSPYQGCSVQCVTPESVMKRSDIKWETTKEKFIPEGTMSPYQDDDRFMIFTRPPKMINGCWIDFPAILIPKEDRLHEFIEEEEPPWAEERNELDFVSEPCDICGDKYGMHHWAACPLRERCLLDEEVGDDWEVVCIFCDIANCPRRCSYPFGRAAYKRTKPLPYMNI